MYQIRSLLRHSALSACLLLAAPALAQGSFTTTDQSQVVTEESQMEVSGGKITTSDQATTKTPQGSVSVTGGRLKAGETAKGVKPDGSKVKVTGSGVSVADKSEVKTQSASKIRVEDQDGD